MADELEQYLARLTEQVHRELRDAIRQEAVKLSEAQKQTLQSLQQAPAESGDLEASCAVVPGANDLEWIVRAGGDKTTGEVREGSGVDFDHGLAFEFGTSRQQARPFFYNTFEARRDDMQAAIDAAVQRAVNE
ncbi:hypothetical protein RPMA_09630 [Tardiphaga alba]|uniref:HK97 gp10 family phage protein n=1 Tax=Tardiphaga alba TaxID=340268 RepID=A0ABX8A8S3_9BRAD|nr:hypothetical protein [Tardiphaga alba]QUS39064.1 hypothetical protein RPMA_09630 [Tardiphaga alba]